MDFTKGKQGDLTVKIDPPKFSLPCFILSLLTSCLGKRSIRLFNESAFQVKYELDFPKRLPESKGDRSALNTCCVQ